MPCFKGVAVSIHTPYGPLPEHSIQKNSRTARISSYIPVPPPRVPQSSTTGAPEQSGFSVSITLLVPGQRVPYSAPKPTATDPYPEGRLVGSLPNQPADFREANASEPTIPPYQPRTSSPNETLAAYIYFDGRPKEEVATLLRKGEETWVNSRWVSIPLSEGGGLAEREFLFREVGLERWLNGLDLVGKDQDKAATIEKRHKKLQKRTESRKERMGGLWKKSDGVLRYGTDRTKDRDVVTYDEELDSDDSDDEPPEAEAAGQIKIALFRVMASGEIKRGEYEAQFDANDDAGEQNDGGDADIEHTTSFAKPKTLDPKSISTQTVTGIDPPDSPFAVFTFLYRSPKQLQKMGIIGAVRTKPVPVASRRKSTDFAKLNPLNKFGTVGFTGYRENSAAAKKKKKDNKSDSDDDMADSDADDDDLHAKRPNEDYDEAETTTKNTSLLSPDDANRQGELSEGVRKIKLKRTHSSEPVTESRKSPHLKSIDSPTIGTPTSALSSTAMAGSPPDLISALDANSVASPFKKHRASMEGLNSSLQQICDNAAQNTAETNGKQSSTDTQQSSGITSLFSNQDATAVFNAPVGGFGNQNGTTHANPSLFQDKPSVETPSTTAPAVKFGSSNDVSVSDVPAFTYSVQDGSTASGAAAAMSQDRSEAQPTAAPAVGFSNQNNAAMSDAAPPLFQVQPAAPAVKMEGADDEL